MNNLRITILFTVLFCLAFNITQAQEPNSADKKKIVIIKKTIDENGEVKTEKTVKELDEDESIFMDGEGKEMNIQLEEGAKHKIIIRTTKDGGEPEVIEWEGEGEMPEEIKKALEEHGHGKVFMHKIEGDDVDIITDGPKKVIIKQLKDGEEQEIFEWDGEGDMPENIKMHMNEHEGHKMLFLRDDHLDEMEIDVDVQKIDGNKKVIIKRMQDGQEPVIIEWDGEGDLPQEMKSEMGNIFFFESPDDHGGNGKVKLSMKIPENNVLLGVKVKQTKEIEIEDGVETESLSDGLEVLEVIEGSAAEEAGLQAGDLITSVDELEVNSLEELLGELGKNKAGDQVNIGFLRNGASNVVTATLKGRPAEYSFDSHEGKEFHLKHMNTDDSNDGIDLKDLKKEIIILQEGEDDFEFDFEMDMEEMKEKISEIKKECILGDGQEVIIIKKRMGDILNKESGDEKVIKEVIVEEVKTFAPAEEPKVVKDLPNRSLTLERFSAFPNPTDGRVTISFKTNPLPAVLRVYDSTGKVVFKENLNVFDGIYSKQLNVERAAKGPLFVNVFQDGKNFTEQIIYQ